MARRVKRVFGLVAVKWLAASRSDGKSAQPHTGEERPRLEAERAQHAEEERVLFEAIAAAAALDELGEEGGFIEIDAGAERNVEILERDGEAMGALDLLERAEAALRLAGADAREIGGELLVRIGHGCIRR